MNLEYLIYLAQTGASHLHPGGEAGTQALITALDLQPAQRVLEIGCGTGQTLVRVARMQTLFVDGVDILPQMLRVARRRVSAARLQKTVRLFQLRQPTALPFAWGAYDRVYCESVMGIQGAERARALLGEIWRVLRRGGLFAALEGMWKPTVSPELRVRLNAQLQQDFGLVPAAENPGTVYEWLDLAQAVGFRVVRADLLQAYPTAPNGWPRHAGQSRTPFALKMVSSYYRAKRFLVPSLLVQNVKYRRYLAKHRGVSQYLESRILVLQKPEME